MIGLLGPESRCPIPSGRAWLPPHEGYSMRTSVVSQEWARNLCANGDGFTNGCNFPIYINFIVGLIPDRDLPLPNFQWKGRMLGVASISVPHLFGGIVGWIWGCNRPSLNVPSSLLNSNAYSIFCLVRIKVLCVRKVWLCSAPSQPSPIVTRLRYPRNSYRAGGSHSLILDLGLWDYGSLISKFSNSAPPRYLMSPLP